MTPVERALLGTGLRFLTGLAEGKEPADALLEAVVAQLPQRRLPPPPPPWPAFNFDEWAARAKAAQQAPPPPPPPEVDPAVAAVQKKIGDLEARAVHPNTPEEEARTAAIMALRLKHKIATPAPPPVRPPASAPTHADRTEKTREPPARHKNGVPRSNDTSKDSKPALLAAARPTCPKCNKPIHRGGVTVGLGDSAAQYHVKCAPRRDL